jgi:hypothetical protein
MPTQNYIALEITAEFPTAGEKTGVFEFIDGEDSAFSAEQAIRTGYLLNNSFDDLAALFTGLTGIQNENGTDRKGLHLDVGGGEHATTVQWQTPGSRSTPDGTVAQWGSSPDSAVGPNRHTATGVADKVIQQQVFMEYLRVGSPDSFQPAKLTFGEYCPNGFLDDYLAVAIEEPSVQTANDNPALADGSMTLVETRNLSLGGDEQQLEDSG